MYITNITIIFLKLEFHHSSKALMQRLQEYYKVKIIFVVMISFFMSRRESKASDNLKMTVMKNFYV